VHQSTPIRGNKPITLGHDYSTIAWIAPDEGRRALPLLQQFPAAGFLFSGSPPPVPSRGAGRSLPFLLRADVFSGNASFL
jgi:hypothetical protein